MCLKEEWDQSWLIKKKYNYAIMFTSKIKQNKPHETKLYVGKAYQTSPNLDYQCNSSEEKSYGGNFNVEKTTGALLKVLGQNHLIIALTKRSRRQHDQQT